MILTILIFDSLDSFREGTCSLFLNSLSAILFTWRCLLVVLSFFLPEASARVFLAVGATALCVETLSFQITSADSTIEAFRMPVLPKSLDPAVRRFDGEFTSVTFGCEQLVPVHGAILVAILNVEAAGSDGLLAMKATEALWMPRLSHGVDAIIFDGAIALGAFWSEIFLVTDFAEELTFLLDEAYFLQRAAASRAGADERVGRECLAQGQNEWTSDLLAGHGTDGDFAGEDGLLDFSASGGSQRRLSRSFRNRRHFRRSGGNRRGRGRGSGFRSGRWSSLGGCSLSRGSSWSLSWSIPCKFKG